jgi:hypothetical protein
MRRARTPILLLCALVPMCLPAAAPAAVPQALRAAASSAVLAARGPTGVRTAFAFERKGLAIAAAGSGLVRVIASSGAASSSAPGRREGTLVALHLPGLGLTALAPARGRALPRGSRAYVLGPPLGYEAARLRVVVLPRMRLDGTRPIRVSGALPASFSGAPVVTRGGTVIGAVASVAAGNWRLAPRGELLALASSQAGAHGSHGPPILSFLLGGLLIFAAGTAFGVMRAKRRRQAALQARVRRAAPSAEQQPLVRLRTPQAAAPDGQGAASEEDFDVIVKSSEEK